MSGFATQTKNISVIQINAEPTAQSFCSCSFRCDFTEVAFAGSDEYESDKSSFIFRRVGTSDTILIKLYKNGVLQATISDDTYGTYYGPFPNNTYYYGFIADWKLIYDALGEGFYTFKADLVVLGSSYSIESRQFQVMPFDEKVAHKTVKIESYQSGNIIGDEFNFTNLVSGGWYQSVRYPIVPNSLKLRTEKNSDRYYDKSYNLIQNRETAKRLYDVNLKLIPDSMHFEIVSFKQLANSLKLSTYDLFSDKNYKNIPVVMDSVSDGERNAEGRLNLQLTFKDYKEDLVKRNV